jgi:hypothetical protein
MPAWCRSRKFIGFRNIGAEGYWMLFSKRMMRTGGLGMYTINENELLTRVHKYELKRDTEKFRIDVHQVLAGTIDDKFFAIPNLLFREDREVDPQFIGCGNTEQEALEDCLKKITSAPLEAIIPPLV